jgi:hypothetical protein
VKPQYTHKTYPLMLIRTLRPLTEAQLRQIKNRLRAQLRASAKPANI